jgi:hypothetical protein
MPPPLSEPQEHAAPLFSMIFIIRHPKNAAAKAVIPAAAPNSAKDIGFLRVKNYKTSRPI